MKTRLIDIYGTNEIMRLGAIIAMLVFLIPVEVKADTVTVRGDFGGDLGLYEVRLGVYQALGIKVRIDGVCASACTILTRLPDKQICATRRAELHFHKARPAPPAAVSATRLRAENAQLFAGYPAGIRAWIDTRGGLTNRILVMPARTLAYTIGRCLPAP